MFYGRFSDNQQNLLSNRLDEEIVQLCQCVGNPSDLAHQGEDLLRRLDRPNHVFVRDEGRIDQTEDARVELKIIRG